MANSETLNEEERLAQAGDIDALLVRLEDASYERRKRAIAALGTLRDARAVPALIAALSNQRLAGEAAAALGQIGDRAAVEPLIASLPHAPFYIQHPIVKALGQIGDPRAVPALETLLYWSGSQSRLIAAGALARLGEPGHQALLAAAARLGGPMETGSAQPVAQGATARLIADVAASAGREAALALGRSGDLRAVPALVRVLASKDRDDRRAAAAVLARCGESGRQALCEAAAAVGQEGGLEAALALAGSGDGRAVALLVAQLGSPPSYGWLWGEGSKLARALAALGQPGIEALVRVAQGGGPGREEAALALAEANDARAVSLLADLMRVEGQQRHRELAEGLARLGQPGIEALAALSSTMGEAGLEAALALAKAGDARALEPLLHAARCDNWRQRLRVAYALAGLGDARAAQPLLDTLIALERAGLYDSERFAAALALARDLAQLGAPAREGLLALLKTGCGMARYAAACALAQLRDPQLVGPLVRASGRSVDYPWWSPFSSRLRRALALAARRAPAAASALVDLLFDMPLPIGWLAPSDEQLGDPAEFLRYNPAEAATVHTARSHRDWLVRGMASVQRIREALASLPGCALKGEILDLLIQASGLESDVRLSDSIHTHEPRHHHLDIKISTEASRKAVERLCQIQGAVSSNILHKVAGKRDISVREGICNTFEETKVDFSAERQLATEELRRRGNPRYDPDAYWEQR